MFRRPHVGPDNVGATRMGETLVSTILLLALSLSLLAAKTAVPESEPAQAVRAFYKAVGEKKCDEALKVRPGYKQKRCEAISNPQVKGLIEKHNEDGVAVFYLDVSYKDGGVPSIWTGFIKVVKKDDRWIITEDYRSDIKYEQYLKEVLNKPAPAEGSTAPAPTPLGPAPGATAPEGPAPAVGSTPALKAGSTPRPGRKNNADLFFNYRTPPAGASAGGGETEGESADTPAAVIEAYFKAQNDKDVEAACKLRTTCSDKVKAEVRDNRGVTLDQVKEKSSDGQKATIHVDSVQPSLDGGNVKWTQDYYLKKGKDGWKIDGAGPASYKRSEPAGPETPEEAVKQYYLALDARDVNAACHLRTLCDDGIRKSTAEHKRVKLDKVESKETTDAKAIIYTESLETQEDGSIKRWKQDWHLRKKNGEWKIDRTSDFSSTVEK